MEIASVQDVWAKFGDYVKASERGPVVITRNGKAVAALIPLQPNQDVEQLLLGCSPQLQKILATARRRIRAGKGIAHDEFWQDVLASGRATPKRKSA